jgi:hypothetical protein
VPIHQLGHGGQYVPTFTNQAAAAALLVSSIVAPREPVVHLTMTSNAVQPALELQILRLCSVADHALT